MDKEIQFNQEEWKVTYTAVPHIIEGYDASGTILNLTIGTTTIPLMACGISTSTVLTKFHQMCANATLMAMAPKLFECVQNNLNLLRSVLQCYESFYQEYKNAKERKEIDEDPCAEHNIQLVINEIKNGISEAESALDKATFKQKSTIANSNAF